MGVLEPGLLGRTAEAFELSLYRHAAGVTGQSRGIVDSVRRRVGSVRTELVTNGVDADRFGAHLADDEARRLVGSDNGPVFVYAGLLGLAQGLDQLLDLARSLPPDAPGRFVLVGDGPVRTDLERRIENERIDRVRLLPAITRERVPALLAASDVAVVPLGLTLPGAVPSKIYEAMAARLPILLVADGEPADIVRDTGSGLTSGPGDLDALRTNFERLASDAALRQQLGSAGRAAAESTYDRTRIAERLDAFLRSCLRPETPKTGG
jgi:glycosyltransferase involved in cell wall biosynthesis